MKKLLSLLTCFLLACPLTGRAEDSLTALLPEQIRLAQDIVIETDNPPLYEYRATLRDFFSCDPSACHAGKIVSTDRFQSEAGHWDDIDYYTFEDGYSLIISGTSLSMGTASNECYSQLLIYLRDAEIPVRDLQGEPFPLQDARERCDRIFEQFGISGLTADEVFPLSPETIRDLTKEMRAFYSGCKLACFDDFPEEIGAWCLSFRQELNGIPVTGDPQVQAVLTRDKIALLEMREIIDTVDDQVPLAEGSDPAEAVRFFASEHSRFHDEYHESMEINRISLGYYLEYPQDPSLPMKAGFFPCWFIESHRSMQFDSETHTNRETECFRIPDGRKYPGR